MSGSWVAYVWRETQWNRHGSEQDEATLHNKASSFSGLARINPNFIVSRTKKQKTFNVYDFTAWNSENGKEASYKVADTVVKEREKTRIQ
jgi:hypothetical protein